jgi:hypothetical protein
VIYNAALSSRNDGFKMAGAAFGLAGSLFTAAGVSAATVVGAPVAVVLTELGVVSGLVAASTANGGFDCWSSSFCSKWSM